MYSDIYKLSLEDFAVMNEMLEVRQHNEEQARKYHEAQAKSKRK